MLKILPILFLIVMIFSAQAVADDFKGNADFTTTYESTGGTVTFPHDLHAEKLQKKCNFCHSALRTFGGVSKIYGHKICGVCHKSMGGPAACNACHNKSAIKTD